MKETIRIGHRLVGPKAPPLIVAEMSGNHNGSLKRALAIVDAAADAGADALKLQTYTADTMTLNLHRGGFRIRDPKSLWKGQSLYQLYKKASTPWEWHHTIFERCRKRGLIFFSTPFDATAVDFLKALKTPVYKIASFEILDLALIRSAAKTEKPLIISTGMATPSEIKDAVQAARGAGCRDLILLKCTSAYPAPADQAHLRTLPDLREKFRCQVGLSDHTLGIGASLAAVALGATVIERHVTLSRRDGGVDSAFSLEPDELKRLVTESRNVWKGMGQIHYGPTPQERRSLIFRRSLYIVQDLRRGERLTPENVRAIRPGYGLAPKYLNALLGKRVKRSVAKGTPVRWDLVGGNHD